MHSLVLVLFGIASVCTGAEWDAFKVTYREAGSGDGYYDMPWTVAEATSQGKWVKLEEEKNWNVDLYSQPEDPSVILLFDKNGIIAGVRLSFFEDVVKSKALAAGIPFEFEYDNNPMYEKGNYFGKNLWYSSVLFTSPNKLASGGRKLLDKASDDVAEGIFYRLDGSWKEMSRDECKPSKDFVEANCFPGMGKHYFYKLEDEDCKHRQPFFGLYDEGKLIGFGIGGFGSFSSNPKTQSYYESFPITSIKSIIAKGPKCIEEYANKFGLMGMHVYLKKDAAKITCPQNEWRSLHCSV